MAYQNVGGSIETTNILLEKGRQERWDYVFVAEAWEGRRGERTMQQGYRVYSSRGSKIALYIRDSEGVELTNTSVTRVYITGVI